MIPAMKRVALVFVLVASLCGAAPKDWKQGKLLDVSISQASLPNGKPAATKLFKFTVDAGDRVYEGQETAKSAPHVEVNAPIECAVQWNNLFVKDSAGKIHKLALMKTIRK